MSDLDAAAQPSCPTCLTVMQPVDGGDECRECGHRGEWPEVVKPEDPDGIIDFPA